MDPRGLRLAFLLTAEHRGVGASGQVGQQARVHHRVAVERQHGARLRGRGESRREPLRRSFEVERKALAQRVRHRGRPVASAASSTVIRPASRPASSMTRRMRSSSGIPNIGRAWVGRRASIRISSGRLTGTRPPDPRHASWWRPGAGGPGAAGRGSSRDGPWLRRLRKARIAGQGAASEESGWPEGSASSFVSHAQPGLRRARPTIADRIGRALPGCRPAGGRIVRRRHSSGSLRCR